MVNAASGLAAQVLGPRINGLRAWQDQMDRNSLQRRVQGDQRQGEHNYHRRVNNVDILEPAPSTPIVRNTYRAERPMPPRQKDAIDSWANFVNATANRRAVFQAMMLMNGSLN